QIVVVTVHAAGRQAGGLVLGEDAGGYRDVEARLVTYERYQVEDAPHGALLRAAHGQHDAELAGPQLGRLPGRLEHLGSVEERRGQDRRVEARGLGAE